jgi:hypothetical protein
MAVSGVHLITFGVFKSKVSKKGEQPRESLSVIKVENSPVIVSVLELSKAIEYVCSFDLAKDVCGLPTPDRYNLARRPFRLDVELSVSFSA